MVKKPLDLECEFSILHFKKITTDMVKLAKIIFEQGGCTNVSCDSCIENFLLNNVHAACPFSVNNTNKSVCYADFGEDASIIEEFINVAVDKLGLNKRSMK